VDVIAVAPPAPHQPVHQLHPVQRTAQDSRPAADEQGETPAPEPTSRRLIARVERREDGVQQVAVVDPHTGEEITRTPASAAIHVVDVAMWQYRIRKERDRG
jgi:uncharacterized iron-regulated membrane protein